MTSWNFDVASGKRKSIRKDGSLGARGDFSGAQPGEKLNV